MINQIQQQIDRLTRELESIDARHKAGIYRGEERLYRIIRKGTEARLAKWKGLQEQETAR